MRIKPYAYPEMPPAECQLCGGARKPGHVCLWAASYEDAGNRWRAVLRDTKSRKVVAVVLGTFPNRDVGSKYRPSAMGAARSLLMDIQAGGRLA